MQYKLNFLVTKAQEHIIYHKRNLQCSPESERKRRVKETGSPQHQGTDFTSFYIDYMGGRGKNSYGRGQTMAYNFHRGYFLSFLSIF